MALIAISLAWLGGTLLGAYAMVPAWLAALGLLPLALLRWRRFGRRGLIVTACALLAFIGAAALYPLRLAEPGNLKHYNDGPPVTIHGVVSQAPEPRGNYTRLELRAETVIDQGTRQPASGKLMLYVPRYTDYRNGDRLDVRGSLKTPEAFDGFDYRGYLAGQGIYSVLYYPDEVSIIARDQGNPARLKIYQLRHALAASLGRALPEPQAALTQGVVLGWSGDIPQPVRDDFSETGTAHLLAISGLHLAIIAGLGLGLGIRLFGRQRYIYIWLALAVIWFYALISGLQTPVLRGAIMVSLFLGAETLGRQRSAMTSLALAAAIIVAINPTVLLTASFQLSFSAMLGLVLITPHIHAAGARGVRRWLGETGVMVQTAALLNIAISVSLGAILMTWPLVAWHFGVVSFTGALGTLLTLPMLPPLIICGALTGLVGLVSAAAAQAIGWLAWLAASYIGGVVQGLASLPFASINVTPESAAWIWAYYTLLGLAAWWLGRRRVSDDDRLVPGPVVRRAHAWLLPLVLIALMLTGGVAAKPDGNYHIYFVDTGQGDAALIRTPEGRNIVIDGGPRPQALSLALGRVLPYRERTIDLMVLTHPHRDHVSDLIPVLERYRVAQVLTPDAASGEPAAEFWRQTIIDQGIPVTLAARGQRIDLDGSAYIEILSPSAGITDATADPDAAGVVLKLVCGEVSLLFTADIGYATEWELIDARQVEAVTVLKVPHHGSAGASSEEFLAVIRPTVAIVSVGADNRFGHPTPETLARLSAVTDDIYRTDINGTVEIITDGIKLWVRPEK
jgi:competence protein ComEC